MKSFGVACVLFLAFAGGAASEQGRWISLETDSVQDAKLAKIALPVMRWRGDAAAALLDVGRYIGLPEMDIIKGHGKLAELYWLRGRYSDAHTVYIRWVLASRKSALGPENPELAKDYNNFALILAAMGRRADAGQHYKRAIEIAANAAGQNPDVAIIRNNYANFLGGGKPSDAQPATSADFRKGMDAAARGDGETALQVFETLADQRDPRGEYGLALLYVEGKGLAQDYAQALKWFTRAAKQGYADAQYHLGVMYNEAEGVARDYAEAAKWWLKAAERGVSEAQYNIGFMYARGRGVPQDYAEAVKWYRKSAVQRNARAQYRLGYMYYYGRAVRQDHGEAIRWIRAAAEQGYAPAQGKLGAYYILSWGAMPRDIVQAYMWNSLSAAQGWEASVKSRAPLERKMTLAQVAEAKRLARDWRPKRERKPKSQ
jgi:TPR repeat protein